MKVSINGMSFEGWRCHQEKWWQLTEDQAMQRLPCDGSAILIRGGEMVRSHLQKTGKLILNLVEEEEEECLIPIKGLCFISL